VDVRELESFVAAAEELHFHRAAARVHLSQPALTRQIRRLEEELGVLLFERTRQRVELTDAGRAFLEEVRVALGSLDRAERRAREIHRGEVGRLAIGHVDGACYLVLQAALRRLVEKQPRLSLRVAEASSADLVPALVAGHYDVIFTWTPPGPSVTGRKLLDEPLVAAVPEDHRLAGDGPLPLAALADEDFIIMPRHMSPVAYRQTEEACRRAGFTMRIREEAHPTFSRLLLVAAGLGVALVPVALMDYVRIGGVVWRRLEGDPVSVPLHMHWRTDDRRATLPLLLELVEAETEGSACGGHGHVAERSAEPEGRDGDPQGHPGPCDQRPEEQVDPE
jgi:DNA-binding transcriptional LysR family regulator